MEVASLPYAVLSSVISMSSTVHIHEYNTEWNLSHLYNFRYHAFICFCEEHGTSTGEKIDTLSLRFSIKMQVGVCCFTLTPVRRNVYLRGITVLKKCNAVLIPTKLHDEVYLWGELDIHSSKCTKVKLFSLLFSVLMRWYFLMMEGCTAVAFVPPWYTLSYICRLQCLWFWSDMGSCHQGVGGCPVKQLTMTHGELFTSKT